MSLHVLQVEKAAFTKVAKQNDTYRDMLIYPTRGEKKSHLLMVSMQCVPLNVVCIHVCSACFLCFVPLQKSLMSQRRRQTYGCQFDPEVSGDIAVREEYVSDDYDSDDLHSSVEGDSSDDEKSSDDEASTAGKAAGVVGRAPPASAPGTQSPAGAQSPILITTDDEETGKTSALKH